MPYNIPQKFYFKQVWYMPNASAFTESFQSLMCIFCHYDCLFFFYAYSSYKTKKKKIT